MNLNFILKNAGLVLVGSLGAQVINVLATPIITRFYSPNDFGILSIFISVTSIYLIFATLKYEFAIPIEKDDSLAKSLRTLSCSLLVFSIVVLVLVLLSFKDFISEFLSFSPNHELLIWLPIGVFFMGLFQIFNYWNTREMRFKRIASSKFIVSVSMSLTQIFGGFFSIGSYFLILGYIVGRIFGLSVLLRGVSKFSLRKFDISSLKKVGKKYDSFPKYVSVAAFTNTLGTQAVPLILNGLYSLQMVGLFSLSMRIMVLPVQLVGQSLGQVLYSTLSKKTGESENNESGVNFLTDIIVMLFSISFPLFSIFILFGTEIFSFAFGAEWAESGYFAKWLCIWLAFSFVSNPLSTIAYIKERQKKALVVTLFETSLRLSAIYFGYYLGDIKYSIIGFSIAGTFITIYYIFWICSISNITLKHFAIRSRSLFMRYLGIILLIALSVNKLVILGFLIINILYDGIALIRKIRSQ